MNHPPAFIVTIERNLQRAKQTQQAFSQHGIQAELWMGVDGAQPIKFNPGESVDWHAFTAQTFLRQHPTMIGAYLSHYRLWQHALKQQWDRIIVFEDDAVPLPNLKRILPRILALDNSHEHINLGPYSTPSLLIANQQSLIQNIDWDQKLVRTVRHGFGVFAYTVSTSGIRKMMPLMMPIQATVDRQIDRPIWEAQMRAFELWPAIVLSEGPNLILYPRGGLRRKMLLKFTKPKIWKAHKRLEPSNRIAAAQYTRQCLLEHAPAKQPGSKPPLPQAGAPHAFVIRTDAIRNQYDTAGALARMGIKAQIWSGVNPDQLKLQPGERAANRLWLRARFGSSRPAGIFARYLSHYRLMQHALKHNLDRIIVLEDGALPHPGFNQLAMHINQLHDSFEFISLSSRKVPKAILEQQHAWMTPLHSEYQLVPSLNPLHLQGGYIASLRGIRKIVPLLMPIRNDLPSTLEGILWLQSVRGYETWPRITFKAPNLWPTYGTHSAAATLSTRIQKAFGSKIIGASRKWGLSSIGTPQSRTEAFLQHKDQQH